MEALYKKTKCPQVGGPFSDKVRRLNENQARRAMHKDTAKTVTTIMIDCCRKLEEAIDAVTNTCDSRDEKEQREAMEFRSAVGKIMGHIFVDVLHPIYQRHPELEPEELKSQRR